MDHPAANERADLVGGELFAGEDAEHARSLGGLRGVDLPDARMRVRRAHENRVGLLRTIDVGNVLTASGDEAEIFAAAYRLSDSSVAHGNLLLAYSAACGIRLFAIACAPVATALTMLW